MTTDRERVAQALRAHDHPAADEIIPWDQVDTVTRRTYLGRADAALAAMGPVVEEVERLRKRERNLVDALDRDARDAQRALRAQSEADHPRHRCGFRVACEAIQQRAAGVARASLLGDSDG